MFSYILRIFSCLRLEMIILSTSKFFCLFVEDMFFWSACCDGIKVIGMSRGLLVLLWRWSPNWQLRRSSMTTRRFKLVNQPTNHPVLVVQDREHPAPPKKMQQDQNDLLGFWFEHDLY